MSTAVAKVAVAVIANTQGFSNGMQRAAKDVRVLSASVKREQDTFDRLKSTFGESSKFGRFAMILGGAGAAGAAMLLARSLGNAAEQMGKVANEVRSGEKGMGDLAEAALGVVPVFGQIWQAGRQIQQGILDTASATAEWLGLSKSVVDWLESTQTKFSRLTEEEKLVNSLRDAVSKAQAQLRQETLSGVEKEKAAIEDRYAAELRNLDKLRQALDNIREEGNRKAGLFALQQLQDALKAIRDAELGKVKSAGLSTSGPRSIAANERGAAGSTDLSKFHNAQRETNRALIQAANHVAKTVDFLSQKYDRLRHEIIQMLNFGLANAGGI